MKRFNQVVFALCVAALAFTSFMGTVSAQDEEVEAAPAVDDDNDDLAFGVMVGYDLDAEELAFGLDARFAIDVADGLDVLANPSLYTYPLQFGDAIGFLGSLNFLIQPDLDMAVDPYIGPGLGVPVAIDPEFDVDFGINAVAGAGFDLDVAVDPFLQFNFYRNLSPGFNRMAVLAGVHF